MFLWESPLEILNKNKIKKLGKKANVNCFFNLAFYAIKVINYYFMLNPYSNNVIHMDKPNSWILTSSGVCISLRGIGNAVCNLFIFSYYTAIF